MDTLISYAHVENCVVVRSFTLCVFVSTQRPTNSNSLFCYSRSNGSTSSSSSLPKMRRRALSLEYTKAQDCGPAREGSSSSTTPCVTSESFFFPSSSRFEADKLSFLFSREDLPPALNNFSFSLPGGLKIGICGRFVASLPLPSPLDAS